MSRIRQWFIDDLRKILDTPEGIRVFTAIMERNAVFSKTFTGNSNTYYLLGKRESAQELMGDIATASENAWIKIMLKKEKYKDDN